MSGCSFQYFNVLVSVRFAWQGRSVRQQDSKVPVKQSVEMGYFNWSKPAHVCKGWVVRETVWFSHLFE